MISASWLLITDYWSLITDYWSLIPDYWSVLPDYWSVITDYWSLITDYWSVLPDYWSLLPIICGHSMIYLLFHSLSLSILDYRTGSISSSITKAGKRSLILRDSSLYWLANLFDLRALVIERSPTTSPDTHLDFTRARLPASQLLERMDHCSALIRYPARV